MEAYIDLARRALTSVEVQFSETEGLENLTTRIRTMVHFPCGESENKINEIAHEIANAIEKQEETARIAELIDQLRSEYIWYIMD